MNDTDDEESPEAPTPSPGSATPTRNRRWPTIAAALALLLGIGAGLALAAAADDPDETAGDPRDARAVAATFGAAYLSFDARSLDLASESLLDQTTERFAAEFRADRLPSVSELFADSSTSTQAVVTETFLSPLVEGRLRAVVLVDVDATAADGAQRLINLSFVVELVEEDDGWKVDGVSPFPVPEVLAPPSPDTTTTVAPTDTSAAPGAG